MVQLAELVTADDRRPAYDPTLCSRCEKRKNQAANPRQRMPLSHTLETAEGILVSRLDDLFLKWLDGYGSRFGLTTDEWIQVFQSLQICFFPSAFADGSPVEPDPTARMDIPPVGLFVRRPTSVIVAREIIAQERQREAGKLTMPDGSAVFTDADLMRLKARREAREGRAVAV